MSHEVYPTPAELQAETDVNDIMRYMDDLPQDGETYESVFIAVHYGYTGEFLDYAFEGDTWADQSDYDAYKKAFEDAIRDTNPDIVVGMVTDRLEAASQELLYPLLDDYNHNWLYTGDRLPLLTAQSLEEMASTVLALEDGAHVVVAGESDDKCVDYQSTLFDTLQRMTGKSFNVEKGPTFPSASVSFDAWKTAREA